MSRMQLQRKPMNNKTKQNTAKTAKKSQRVFRARFETSWHHSEKKTCQTPMVKRIRATNILSTFKPYYYTISILYNTRIAIISTYINLKTKTRIIHPLYHLFMVGGWIIIVLPKLNYIKIILKVIQASYCPLPCHVALSGGKALAPAAAASACASASPMRSSVELLPRGRHGCSKTSCRMPPVAPVMLAYDYR